MHPAGLPGTQSNVYSPQHLKQHAWVMAGWEARLSLGVLAFTGAQSLGMAGLSLWPVQGAADCTGQGHSQTGHSRALYLGQTGRLFLGKVALC